MVDGNAWIGQYGYLAVLLGALVEGDGIAILAGIAARHGYLDPGLTILATGLGGALSDITLYLLGRRYGESVLRHFPRQQSRIERARSMVRRHEHLWVIGVRFAYGFRIAGPLIIGSSGVPVRRFLLLNLLGTGLWAATIVLLGYWVGNFLYQFFTGHPHLGAWLGASLGLVVLLWLLVRRIRRHQGL